MNITLLLNLASVVGIYLLARSLPNAKKFPLLPEISALFLVISPWLSFISRDGRVSLLFLVTILGIYLLIRFFKKYLLLSVITFLVAINFLLVSALSTQDPIWLTIEQRREHGSAYNNPLVVLEHNKVINYSLSFLDHYFQHFQGDFLFINGDVRENFALMYLFDLVFIAVAVLLIVKKPQGWGIILVWLALAPIPSALDLQPPNVLKSFNMLAPLVLLSSLGLSVIISKLKK